MKLSRSLFYITLFVILSETNSASLARRKKLAFLYSSNGCTSVNYLCHNHQCIQKSWYCDGVDDCGDNSDEQYCREKYHNYRRYNCPSKFIWCGNSICIPEQWKCDGVVDCPDLDDEIGCTNKLQLINGTMNMTKKAEAWIRGQANTEFPITQWGSNVPRIAVGLYFASSKYFAVNNVTGQSLTYEVSQRLLMNMIREKMNIEALSSSELAHYLNALTISCTDARDFNGVNLVELLSQKIEKMNYASPFPLLTLCIVGHSLSAQQINQLHSLFQNSTTRTDKLAFALMALSCIVDQGNSQLVSVANLSQFAMQLKKKQHEDGRFENVATTALILQALIASGEVSGEAFLRAMRYLADQQTKDGSFGSLLSTYYALPVLPYKSLLDINTEHCKRRKKNNDSPDQSNRLLFKTQYIDVTYSISIGDEFNIVHVLTVSVPANSTFFDVMKAAATKDQKYEFKYSIRDSKPYIYEIGGNQDDAESEAFWYLFNGNEKEFYAVYSSPVDVVISEDADYMMWYRTDEIMCEARNSTMHRTDEGEHHLLHCDSTL